MLSMECLPASGPSVSISHAKVIRSWFAMAEPSGQHAQHASILPRETSASAPPAATRPPSFRKSPVPRGGHRPGRGSRPGDDTVFVRQHFTMIAAPVQCDVDGISKGPHYARVPPKGSSSKVGPLQGEEALKVG